MFYVSYAQVCVCVCFVFQFEVEDTSGYSSPSRFLIKLHANVSCLSCRDTNVHLKIFMFLLVVFKWPCKAFFVVSCYLYTVIMSEICTKHSQSFKT